MYEEDNNTQELHYNHDEHKVENIILLSSRTYTSSFELSPVR